MRVAPQRGFARLIWRIRSRISWLMLGRPRRRDRRHWTTVVGLTSTMAPRTGGQIVMSHPEQLLCTEELRAARALPTQHGTLLSQGTSSSSSEARLRPERKPGTDGGQKGAHSHDGGAWYKNRYT